MSMQEDLDRLGAYRHPPPRRIVLRITQLIDPVLLRLFIHDTGRLVSHLVFTLLLIIAVASKTIQAVASPLFTAALVLGLMGAWQLYADRARSVALGPVTDLLLGRPLFGDLGGYRTRQFFAYERLSREVSMKFDPEDEAAVRRYTDVQRELARKAFMRKYARSIGRNPDTERKTRKGNRRYEIQEAQLWKEVQSRYQTAPVTPDKYISMYASTLVPDTVERNNLIVAKIFDWMSLCLTLSLVFYLDGAIDIDWLARILTICTVVVAIVFALYLHIDYESITLSLPSDTGDPDITEVARGLPAPDKTLFGRVVKPLRVTIGPNFIHYARGYLLRAGVLLGAFSNTILVIWLSLLSLVAGLIFSWNSSHALQVWFWHLTIGVVVVTVLLLVSFFITSLVLERLKSLVLFLALFFVSEVWLLPVLVKILGLHTETSDVARAVENGGGVMFAAAFAWAIAKVLEEAIGSLGHRAE